MSQQPDVLTVGIMMSSYYRNFIEKKKQFEGWCANQIKQGVSLIDNAAYNALAKRFEDNYIKPLEEYERKFKDGKRNVEQSSADRKTGDKPGNKKYTKRGKRRKLHISH